MNISVSRHGLPNAFARGVRLACSFAILLAVTAGWVYPPCCPANDHLGSGSKSEPFVGRGADEDEVQRATNAEASSGSRESAADSLPRGPLRLIIVFTPNGMVRDGFWPQTPGAKFEMTPVLQPLAEYRDQMLLLHGLCNRIRGDGDNHMRGIAALLTGKEMFPGNIQGGSHEPAGWSRGISIDQEIKQFLQSNPVTGTRFGTLEFGICVRNDANPWTRMVYAGPNQPIAPVSDPYQMFNRMFGAEQERENLSGVLSGLEAELVTLAANIEHSDDQQRLRLQQKHYESARQQLSGVDNQLAVAPPHLPPGESLERSNMPQLSKMQMDLLVNGMANNLNRIATVQFTESVGNAQMTWLGIEEGHHALSHDPDLNEKSQNKLTKINQWYAGQLAYLLSQLEAHDDPTNEGTLLDNTLVVWTNELGHGNSHTLDNIPMLLMGGKNFGFSQGYFARLGKVPHNRFWLAIAQRMGHRINEFGNPKFCRGGPLQLEFTSCPMQFFPRTPSFILPRDADWIR